MRIKSIRVRNFKSFKDCTINFNDFNVVIGSNASGKSNLVQIFKFLKDIEEYGLENAISLQGGVEYFTNNQIGASEDFSLEIVFSYDNPDDLLCFRQSDEDKNIFLIVSEYKYKFCFDFDKLNSSIQNIKEDELLHKVKLIEKLETPFKNQEHYNIFSEDHTLLLKYVQNKGFTIDTDSQLAKYINLDKLWSNRQDYKMLEPLFLLLEDTIFWILYPYKYEHKFKHIGIFDFDPKLPKKATPITGKIDLEEDGSNLAIVLNKILRDPEKQRQLSNLFTDLLPFIDTLKVEKFADKSLMFKLKETYAKNNEYLPAAFISDGTINIVALIIALYFSNTSFTIIEEPEKNLHPSLISKVVEMMKDASKQKQTLVTTHNPEMIKYADLEDILLISRDEDGFSQITRPADSEQVKIFLENEIGMDELYIQNLLG